MIDLPPRRLVVTGRRDGTTLVLVVAGELDLASVPDLDAALKAAQRADETHILLDLTKVEFIDTVGLAALVQTSERFAGESKRLTIRSSTHAGVRRILELTELDTELPFE